MINKITIDVTKIDKSKLRNGKYLELVQIPFKDGERDKTKQDGSLIEGNGRKLVATGIVKQDGSKDEQLPILGDTTKWVDKDAIEDGFEPPVTDEKTIEYPEDEINPDSIPF